MTAALGPRPALLAAATLLLVAAGHWPLRDASYVQDDHIAIEENAIVARGDLLEILTTSYWEGAKGADRRLYRPATILSHALERALVGASDPAVGRGVNVALHATTTLLLLLLLARLRVGPLAAWAATLLYAVHPIHVEAIANVVGRAEIQAALFGLGALWLATYSGAWPGRDPRPAVRRAAAWGAAACVGLALGSKEVAIAVPVLLVVLERLYRPAPAGRDTAWWIDRAAALAPSALAVVVYAVLRVSTLETFAGLQLAHPIDNPIVGLDGSGAFATALALVPRYAALLLYPVRLSADYSGPAIAVEPTLLAWRPLLGLALLTAVAVAAARGLLRGRPPAATFGAVLLLLPYLVVGNLLAPIGTIFAERLMYLPSAGFCVLAGLGLASLGRLVPAPSAVASTQRRRFVWGLVCLFVLAYGMRTWARCFDWRDDGTVFSAATRASPRSARPHFVVGKLMLDDGDAAGAVRAFERARRLAPDYVAAAVEQGVALGRLQRYDEALAVLDDAVGLSPVYGTAWYNRALVLRRLGRTAEAERSLRRATLWDPEFPKPWVELGNLRLDAERYAAAAAAYRRAIELGRVDVAPRLRRAEALDARAGDDR